VVGEAAVVAARCVVNHRLTGGMEHVAVTVLRGARGAGGGGKNADTNTGAAQHTGQGSQQGVNRA
jgi:hypothetical protein